jgi:hypothetical protein
MSTTYGGEGKQEGREEMRRGGNISRLQRKKRCDSFWWEGARKRED